jgi:NAD-dependent deacetylase
MSMSTEPLDPETLAAIARDLRSATSVLFVTGAGISADSGLPTYRGVGGLYAEGDPEEGLPIEDILSGETFAARPELSWKHIARIEQACRGAKPNRAHEVIALVGERIPRSWVLTQNVDGLHTAAGAKNVIEIHGSVHKLTCTKCDYRERVTDYAHLAIPPRCPRCAAIVRPEVVLFGEALPLDELNALRKQQRQGFDIVFSIGTSGLFPYIARPILDAGYEGVPTVEIDPGETTLSNVVRYRVRARAAVAMDAIWKAFAWQ